jgi:rhamnosyl/mannosyltransferase
MKVLQFGKHFPPDLGGIESVIKIITCGLNQAGVRTDVLCANTRNLTLTDSIQGFTVTRVASWGKFASTALAPKLIWWFAKVHKQYDIIHVHMPDPLAIMAILIVQPKAHVVLHWHGDVDFAKFKWLGRIYKPFNRLLIRRADKVIVATQAHLHGSADRDLFADKAALIPFPLDPDFAERAKDRLRHHNRTDGRFRVFAVGRLIYYKGFEYLIECARYLPHDCEVVIGGDGPLREILQQQIQRLGVGDRVRLAGRLSDDDLLQAYANCDAFCLPSISRGEMFGMVQIEAMCLGKPIVATRIPNSGVTEVNIDGVTGLVVPVMDSRALADALLRLKNDPAMRYRMSEQASERARTVYGSHAVIPQLISLYQNLLSRDARGMRSTV